MTTRPKKQKTDRNAHKEARKERERDRQREKNDFHRDHGVLVRSPFFFFHP
jgi:hypothetical protein